VSEDPGDFTHARFAIWSTFCRTSAGRFMTPCCWQVYKISLSAPDSVSELFSINRDISFPQRGHFNRWDGLVWWFCADGCLRSLLL